MRSWTAKTLKEALASIDKAIVEAEQEKEAELEQVDQLRSVINAQGTEIELLREKCARLQNVIDVMSATKEHDANTTKSAHSLDSAGI